jgi:hypothetical protein
MLWIWLVCFTVFTVILGAGLQFYQVQVEVSSHYDESIDPLYATLRQGGVILVTLMFTAAAIAFLGAAIRWVDRTRD